MAYNPLEVGGADYYPVKVGSMLLTIVDPNPGYERAYNRWYERDHYYGGCMVGPWLFAGSRWVATRELKDLRWPAGSTAIADPTDGGSYVAIYWVEEGHHEDHFDEWATTQVFALYEGGRGFSERTHRHTVLFSHIAAVYRDEDPVPVSVALDHCYDGIVLAWFDAADGDAYALHDRLSEQLLPELLAGSGIEIASSWTPHPNEAESKKSPMPLGTPGGGPDRLCQIFFLHGDVRDEIDRVRAYTDAVEAAGLATTLLVAPWFRTVPGTDTYVDELF